MNTKLYEKIKNFIIENYLTLLFYFVFVAIMLYPLPYYIYTGGGILSVDSKIIMDNKTKSKGSYNLCYVSEINATLPTYLLSYIIPGWDLTSKKETTLNDKEKEEDVIKRDHLDLLEANQNAILNAFSYSNSNYSILSNNYYILYIDTDSNTNLKVGDKIVSIDDKNINEFEDISEIIKNKEIGSKVNIKVINKKEELEKYAYVFEKDNKKMLGIALVNLYDYETTPKVEFNFSNSESGPSGGLMLSLALYDNLVSEDITKGYKIAGTGTIDKYGNVGEIGGIKYKLKGAVKAKSDIFIVANGNNYNECVKLKEKYNYDIKIIGVSTFEEAITKLKNLK